MFGYSCQCASGNSSLGFAFPMDSAKTSLANDIKPAKREGKKQFNGLIDVYKKTFQSDGIVGLYRGFNISMCWKNRVLWTLLGLGRFFFISSLLSLINYVMLQVGQIF